MTASGTESEEDDFQEYLVPEGCTATIACELEENDKYRKLSWRRDGQPISYRNTSKIEHLVNGLKHYLIIRDAHPEDSACYSVCIDSAEFKVAHVVVSSSTSKYAALPTKRISSSSLQNIV